MSASNRLRRMSDEVFDEYSRLVSLEHARCLAEEGLRRYLRLQEVDYAASQVADNDNPYYPHEQCQLPDSEPDLF